MKCIGMLYWSSLWLAAFVFSMISATAVTATHEIPDSAVIKRFVEGQMRLSQIPDVALVIVRRDRPVYSGAWSLEGARITLDTPFLIGSVTKTFTALAIAQLVDAGKLQFDDPVYLRLPGFSVKSADGGRSITLRHLLTHTSGLRQWSGHDRRAQTEARFDHITPARLPGKHFEYSSLNYIIVGEVVEAASGMSYGDYIRRHIFEPLKMDASFTDLKTAYRKGLAQGHRYFFGLPIKGQESQQPLPLVPAGFIISSGQDLGNYLQMLLNNGRFTNRQIVSSKSLREMLQPWGGGTTGAGMAWGVGNTSIGHAGNSPTFSARLSLLPVEGYGIVLLSTVNSGPFFSGTASLMDGLIRILRAGHAKPARPDEILFKLFILALVLLGLVRTALRFRQWSGHGFPLRLKAKRRVLKTLATEAVSIALVLVVVPRWIGVPLRVILEYFPDLGLAIIVGVIAGAAGALMRSFVYVHDTPAPSNPAKAVL